MPDSRSISRRVIKLQLNKLRKRKLSEGRAELPAAALTFGAQKWGYW
jgi:hypothetical protein